jgi:hypothetical protein
MCIFARKQGYNSLEKLRERGSKVLLTVKVLAELGLSAKILDFY